jgi:hypothetical protein
MVRRKGSRSRPGPGRFALALPFLLVGALAVSVGGIGGFVLASGRRSPPQPGLTTSGLAATSPSVKRIAPTAAPPSNTPPPTTTTTAAPQPTASPSTRTRVGASLLRRHDALPAGVAAEMTSFFGGAGGLACDESIDPPPTQPTVSLLGVVDTVAIGAEYDLCLINFTSGKPVSLRITRPDGSVERRTVCPDCPGSNDDPSLWVWSTVPGDPIGSSYRFRATQGDLVASATYDAQYQQEPLLRVVEHNSRFAGMRVRGGADVHVVLAGFPPSQVMVLLVYHARGGGVARYIASQAVQADVRGQRLYVLHTTRQDPAGCYVLRTQPAVNYRALPGVTAHIDQFCLA